jgi:hypothetical protein
MIAVSRGLQSKIYKRLRESQDIQMEVKQASRGKIRRSLEMIDSSLKTNPAKMEMLINDPEVFLPSIENNFLGRETVVEFQNEERASFHCAKSDE